MYICERKYTNLKNIVDKIIKLLNNTYNMIKSIDFFELDQNDNQLNSLNISSCSDLDDQKIDDEKAQNISEQLIEKVHLHSQKFNQIFDKLLVYYNKLFQKKYRQIFYSKRFRDFFQIFRIIDHNNREISNVSYDQMITSNYTSLKNNSYSSDSKVYDKTRLFNVS